MAIYAPRATSSLGPPNAMKLEATAGANGNTFKHSYFFISDQNAQKHIEQTRNISCQHYLTCGSSNRFPSRLKPMIE